MRLLMKNVISIYALIILLMVLLPSSLCARDDWQNWNMVQLNANVNKQLTARIRGEQWLTQDFSRISLNNVDAGFLWKPAAWFEVGPFYRYQYVDALSGENSGENRYYTESSLRHRVDSWEFSDRNRIEFHETTRNDFWVYRNEVRLTRHFKAKNIPFSSYLSEELFHRSDAPALINESRASAGLQARFHKHFGITLFYLIRHTKGKADWKSDQVLGTIFQFYL